MNYMEQVAQMLGVELYEPFKIKCDDDIYTSKYFLTESGLESDGCSLSFDYTLNNILNGYYEIIKIPKTILDDIEKEYLSNIIKPFRKRIVFIRKGKRGNGDEYIKIQISDYFIIFPDFKEGTMYKGMEVFKEYSLDELGL